MLAIPYCMRILHKHQKHKYAESDTKEQSNNGSPAQSACILSSVRSRENSCSSTADRQAAKLNNCGMFGISHVLHTIQTRMLRRCVLLNRTKPHLKVSCKDAHLACVLADFLNCSYMGWQTYLQGSAQAETCTTWKRMCHME
jgi:hypothetical protein